MKFSDFSRRNSHYCVLAAVLFGFAVLFAFPSEASYFAEKAIFVCLERLIPSLFPFFVLSSLAVSCGFRSVASKVFARPVALVFNSSPEAAVPFVLGLLSGFPVGATSTAELYLRGEMSKSDCEKALCFSNFPSAGFIVSAVGVGVFGSARVGWLLFAVVTFSGIFAAAVVCRFCGKPVPVGKISTDEKCERLLPAFISAVVSSAKSVLSVSAFVVFFSVICGIICSVLPLPYPFFAIVSGFFEISSGAAALTSDITAQNLALAAALLAWSGLSVHFQVLSRLPQGVSPKPYLLSKAFSAVLAALFSQVVFLL